jgi:hypothetical protein
MGTSQEVSGGRQSGRADDGADDELTEKSLEAHKCDAAAVVDKSLRTPAFNMVNERFLLPDPHSPKAPQ